MSITTDKPGQESHRVLQQDSILNEELAKDMVRRTDKLTDETIDLALRVKQAREFMAWSASHVRNVWMDWIEESNAAIRHMNELRMAFDRETKSVKASGKDISDFFNSPEYLKAHATLQETLSMLQGFQKMKNDGTLDAFADFILKIKCT